LVTFEKIKLLETKVAKTIDHINRITEENSLLRGKLETYRKRVDELEGLVKRFKEDQSRIEEGILSALERLNQFEDAVGKSLSPTPPPASVPDTSPAGPLPAVQSVPLSSGEPASQPLSAVQPAAAPPQMAQPLAAPQETAERSETAMRSQVPGIYLDDEDELSGGEFQDPEDLDEDETPEDRTTGELDIF
jgi:hypothetical protein